MLIYSWKVIRTTFYWLSYTPGWSGQLVKIRVNRGQASFSHRHWISTRPNSKWHRWRKQMPEPEAVQIRGWIGVQIPTREVRKVRQCRQTLLYAQDRQPYILSTAQHKHVGLSVSPGADDVTASGWLCCWRRRRPFPLMYCQPREALRAKSFDLFFNFVFLAIVKPSSRKRSGRNRRTICGVRMSIRGVMRAPPAHMFKVSKSAKKKIKKNRRTWGRSNVLC